MHVKWAGEEGFKNKNHYNQGTIIVPWRNGNLN